MTNNKILRVIVLYDKKTELFEKEIVLDDFDLSMMKNSFTVPGDDPLMYNCYIVDQSKTRLFPKIDFNFNKYDYYVECHTE